MPLTSPNFVAGGNILPRRFVSPQVAATYWTTGGNAYVGDLRTMSYGGSLQLFVCLTAHVPGTFVTDYVTNGYWALVQPQPSSRTA